MSGRLYSAVGLFAIATIAAACESTKSSNPLSPTVAGPIPGVNITAPNPVTPSSGAKIAVDQQPLTLTVENSATSGVRPLNYVFEVATDADFTNKVFSRDGIAPGDGKTTLRLPDRLAPERSYYWRARAQDGANTGPYSGAATFNVFTPIVIQPPGPVSPVNNVKADSLHPKFTWTNAPRSGPVGAIAYVIEVSDTDSFANKVAIWTVGEQSSQTGLDAPQDLAYSKQYFWHVRAYDPTTNGPWSPTQVFQTPDPPPIVPPTPTPTPTPGPTPGPAPNDAINLGGAVIEGGSPPDVASRPATATITGIDITSGGVRVDFTRKSGAGRWPDVTPPGWDGPLQYTLWLALKVNGVWHTAGIIEYWYGLDMAGGDISTNNQIPRNWTYYIPAMRYQPAPGEQVGFFVTAGDQRMKDVAAVRERSNVVVIPFPPPGGGSFRF